MNFISAQSIKLCKADFDSIATQTGLVSSLDKIIDRKQQVLSALIKMRGNDCFVSSPPPFSKDHARQKQYEDYLAREKVEKQKQINEIESEFESFSKKMTDSLRNEIRNQIGMVATDRGCTSVLETKAMLFGGEEITDQVILQIRRNRSISSRWHLSVEH